jgi:hypothetical protein
LECLVLKGLLSSRRQARAPGAAEAQEVPAFRAVEGVPAAQSAPFTKSPHYPERKKKGEVPEHFAFFMMLFTETTN